MGWKFFIIGAITIASLLGAQAFAAGGDDYAPTAAKPAAYNKALVLIKNNNYDKAIVKLKEAEAAAKKIARSRRKKKPDAKKLDAKKRHLLPLLLVVVVLRCPPRNSVGIGNARRNWSAA